MVLADYWTLLNVHFAWHHFMWSLCSKTIILVLLFQWLYTLRKKKNHLDFYYIRHSDLLYLKLNSSYITESDIVMIHLWSIPWCVWLYPYDQCPGQGLTHGLKWIMGCFTVNWKEMLSFIDLAWTWEDAGLPFANRSDPASKNSLTLKKA